MRMMRFVVAASVSLALLSLGGASSWRRTAVGAEAASRASPAKSASPRKVSAEGRKAIDQGTRWLMKAIRRDGGVGPDIGTPPELGCTAIVGLALLSQGNTPDKGPRALELRRILDYILHEIEQLPGDQVPLESNTLLQRKIGKHAPLFLMTLFLSQVHGEEKAGEEVVIRNALQRLVKYISAAQQPDGTWGDQSWAPVLGTVLGWESLRAAASAGIVVEANADNIGAALLAKLKERSKQDASNWMFAFYKETASLRVLHSLGYQDDPSYKETMDRVLKMAQSEQRLFSSAGGEEFIAFYLVTELMIKQKKNEAAAGWYPAVRDKLIKIQNEDGSWTGHHCITSRTFCTAAALMTLQAPDLALPTSDL